MAFTNNIGGSSFYVKLNLNIAIFVNLRNLRKIWKSCLIEILLLQIFLSGSINSASSISDDLVKRGSVNALVGGLHWFVNIGAQDVPRRLCPLQTPFVCSSLQGFPRCYSPLNCANVFLGLAVQRQIQIQRQRQIQRWRHHLSATRSKALQIYCAK